MVRATTRNPQFFRIVLPGSLQELAIPRRFLKYLREGKYEKGEAVLRSRGKSWRVKIHGSYFKEGWADFARDCLLLIGDFLVFQQHPDHMVFDVILFDRSACEKEYPSVHAEDEIRNRDFQSTQRTCPGVTEATKTSCALSCKNPFFVATMGKSNLQKPVLCIPRNFAKSNGLKGKSGFVAILRDECLRSWSVTLRQNTDGRVYFGSGWHDFALANRLKKKQVCIFKLISCGNTIQKGDGNLIFDVSVVDSKPSPATSSKDFSFTYSHESHKSENKVAQNRTFAEEERQNDERTTLEDFRQNRKPHFFKPFLPDSYQQLKIPEEFLKHMTSENCKDGEEVTLKNPRCKSKSWPVKLKEFCFKEGWSNFVKDHELCLGEFVVFSHEGGLVFDVIIFDHSTCEKETYPALHMNTEDNKSAVEKKIKGSVSFVLSSSSVRGIGSSTTLYDRSKEAKTSSSTRQTSFDALGKQFVIQRPHRKQPMVPSDFVRSNGISRSMYKVIIRDQKGRSWPVKVTADGNKRRLGGGWLEFLSANCVKEEDICVFKRSSSGKIRNGDTIVLDFSIFNSNNRGATTVDKNDKIEFTNPSFEKTFMPFNFTQHRLYVPRCFARLNGMTGKTCKITLIDGRGMQWSAELRCNESDGQVYILSDWTQICASNNWKIGDTCTFELTPKGKQKAMEFSLHLNPAMSP